MCVSPNSSHRSDADSAKATDAKSVDRPASDLETSISSSIPTNSDGSEPTARGYVDQDGGTDERKWQDQLLSLSREVESLRAELERKTQALEEIYARWPIDRLRAKLERKEQRLATAEHLLTLAREYMRNYDMGDLRGIDGWDDDVSDFLEDFP